MSSSIASTPLVSDGNLVAYWPLEDVNPSVGGATLTNNGSVTFTAAEFNNGANFGTSNSSKSLTANSNVGVTHLSMSFHIWIKILTQPSNATHFLFNARTTDGGSNFIDWNVRYVDSGGTKSLQFIRSRPGVADDTITYTFDLGTTSFHQIDMTYDGTNLRGYVDGAIQAGPTAFSGVGAGGANAVNLGFGGSNGWLSGLLDDFAIFTRTLSATEVSNLWNGWPTTTSTTITTSTSSSTTTTSSSTSSTTSSTSSTTTTSSSTTTTSSSTSSTTSSSSSTTTTSSSTTTTHSTSSSTSSTTSSSSSTTTTSSSSTTTTSSSTSSTHTTSSSTTSTVSTSSSITTSTTHSTSLSTTSTISSSSSSSTTTTSSSISTTSTLTPISGRGLTRTKSKDFITTTRKHSNL